MSVRSRRGTRASASGLNGSPHRAAAGRRSSGHPEERNFPATIRKGITPLFLRRLIRLPDYIFRYTDHFHRRFFSPAPDDIRRCKPGSFARRHTRFRQCFRADSNRFGLPKYIISQDYYLDKTRRPAYRFPERERLPAALRPVPPGSEGSGRETCSRTRIVALSRAPVIGSTASTVFSPCRSGAFSQTKRPRPSLVRSPWETPFTNSSTSFWLEKTRSVPRGPFHTSLRLSAMWTNASAVFQLAL